MTRALYIGGYGNGRSSAERTGNALSRFYEEVDAFTFSDFMRVPELMQKAIIGADLVTHSGGALALGEPATLPEAAYLLNPPLPRSIGQLLLRSAIKTVRMHTPGVTIHKGSDIAAVTAYSASSAAEFAAHPAVHARALPVIARFNALQAAAIAQSRGIETHVSWTDGDAYFMPTSCELQAATEGGVQVTMLPGEHDEVVLRPEAHLERVFNSQTP